MNLLGRFREFTTGTPLRTLISSILLTLLIPVTLLASAQRWELRKEAVETPLQPPEVGPFVTVEFPQGLVGVSKAEEEARVATAIQEKFGTQKRYEIPEELKELGLQEGIYDFVVIYTQNGKPLRPDLEKLTNVSQIGHEDNNLTFTFDSPEHPWTPEEETALREHLDNAYPLMKEIAGPPAFDITANVRKEAECPEGVGGYYNVTRNVITICQDTLGLQPQLAIEIYKATSTHEMGHAFHDDAVFGFASFEEGFAESMSTEVDIRLGTLGEPNKYHVLNMWYENQNKKLLAPWWGSFGLMPFLRALRYLSSGFAWSKVYIEHDDFFRLLHKDYYQRFYEDPSISRDKERIKNLMKLYASSVENMPFDEWFAKQHVLGSRHEQETHLYSFFAGLGNINAVVGFAFSFGGWPYPGEYPLPNEEIGFICETLFSKEKVCEGTMVTDEQGFAYYLFPLEFAPREPFKISLTADSLADETFGLVPSGAGLFGITAESSGILTATHGSDESTTTVSNGKFSVLEPLLFRGRVDLRFEGEKTFEKSVTKDSSPYFIHLACLPESTIPGDLDCGCDVDLVDLVMIARIYGSREGDEDFNPDLDLVQHEQSRGVINIFDLVYVAAKYGTSCSD